MKWSEEIKVKWKVGVRLKVYQSDYQLGWIEVWEKKPVTGGVIKCTPYLESYIKGPVFQLQPPKHPSPHPHYGH